MSIRSDYDPEYERIKKARRDFEERLGPLWFCCKDEKTFIEKLKLKNFTDEETRHALHMFRQINNGAAEARDPKPQYPKAVVVGCIVLTIILFLLGLLRG